HQWSADRFEKYPISPKDMNKHYENLAYKDDFYQMTAFDDKEIVGHLIMRFTDEEKKILRFGFVIVDYRKRGKGYGKEMLQLALKYAFEILKVDKVTLGVFENNESAYYCYKSLGFMEASEGEFEYFHILDEEWKCFELEIERDSFKFKDDIN
ncbi:MAG: GNAT family N-acetyltransferase, partial [Clostridium sp.]